MFQTAFSSFDLFGTPVIFNFAGKEKVKTRFGLTCSVLFCGFVIWVIYNASQEMFNRTNPKTTSSETYHQNPREMVISEENFPIAFGIKAPEALQYKYFIDESIFTLDLTHYSVKSTKLSNGTTHVDRITTKVTLETCKPEFFGNLLFAFENLDLSSLICISPNQPELDRIRLQGTFVSPIYETLVLTVNTCNSETSACKDPEIIKAYMEGGYFNVIYADMVLDPNNYTHPDARFQEIYSKTLSLSLSKGIDMLLSHIGVATDSGWLAEDKRTDEFVKITKTTEGSQARDNYIPLLSCSFIVNKLETTYTRSYKKILTVLAEVASLANTVLMVLIIVASPYLKLSFRGNLMNQFFDVDMDPDIKSSAKKPKQQLRSHLIEKDNSQHSEVKQNFNISQKNELTRSPINQESQDPDSRKDSSDSPNRENVKVDVSAQTKTSEKINQAPKIKSFQSLNILTEPKTDYKEKQDKSFSLPRINFWKEQSEDRIYRDKFECDSHNLPLSNSKDGKTERSQVKPSMLSTKQETVKLEMKILEDEPEEENFSASLSKRPNSGLKKIERMLTIEEYNPMNTGQEADQENIEKEHCELQMQDDVEIGEVPSPSKEDEEDENKFSSNSPKFQELDINIWEYLLSFFYKPKYLRRKLKILEIGQENIGKRLDVVNILRKLREVDKIRALLFDKDQLVLFNNLPKPEVSLKAHKKSLMKKAFSVELLKEVGLDDNFGTIENVQKSYIRLKNKKDKTELDERLLNIFTQSLNNSD